MELTGAKLIAELENGYIQVLFDHCRSLFKRCYLPSHDHHHHMRVWQYSKKLLLLSRYAGNYITRKNILSLMLAAFFHDTGLTKTMSEEHGKESRQICRSFLDSNPDLFPCDTEDALNAIEMHDIKELCFSAGNSSGPDTLKLLSICDDIDAYGALGVLRYAEIYHLRGITMEELSEKVIKNMTSRFMLLTSQDWIPGTFFALHKKRFYYALSFFRSLNMYKAQEKETPVNLEIINLYMNEIYLKRREITAFPELLNNSRVLSKKEFSRHLMMDLQNQIY